nr:hypothetical protein OG499_04660 [Streptomyces anulatus]
MQQALPDLDGGGGEGERRLLQEAVVLGDPQFVAVLRERGEAPVRDPDALGVSGGARGEHDERGVLRVLAQVHGVRRALCRVGDQLVGHDGARPVAEPVGRVRFPTYHQVRPGLLDDAAHDGRRVRGIERDHAAARLQHEQVGRAAEMEAHGRAGRHAAAAEGVRRSAGAAVQLRVGDAFRCRLQCCPVGVQVHHIGEGPREGAGAANVRRCRGKHSWFLSVCRRQAGILTSGVKII